MLCLKCQSVCGVNDNELQQWMLDTKTSEAVIEFSANTHSTEECSQKLVTAVGNTETSAIVEDITLPCAASKDKEKALKVFLEAEKEEEGTTNDLNQSSSKNTHVPCAESELQPSFVNQSSCSSVQPDAKRAKLENQLCAASACSQVCVMCLGLLDDVFLGKLTNFIADELNGAQYTALETFTLAIHAPLSLSIRQAAINLFAQKLKNSSLPLYIEHVVKEQLRDSLKLSLQEKLSPLVFSGESPFQITVFLSHDKSVMECKNLKKLKPSSFPRPRNRRKKSSNSPLFTNIPVSKALEELTFEDFKQNKHLLALIERECSYNVKFYNQSLYVAGRYNKFSRHLSQTPWVVDGVKKAETSVQELLSHQLLSLTRAESCKFSASGREDVDVRMLGNGRPFVIELLNPHKVKVSQEELLEVNEAINKSSDLIAVQQLKQVDKESLSKIKEGEEDKRKHYCALIWIEKGITYEELKPLTSMKDVKIAQKTPIRVLHRRTLATRERTIYSMNATLIDSHHFKLYLCTQAGTYIKEFVHGDFGRTKPNLGLILGQNVDILTLDVENVELDWPPP